MSLWSRLERRLGDLAGELVLDEYRDQLNQARALLARGDVPAAIETLEALLAVKPEHGQALIALGDARLATRDPQHAYDAYERALQIRAGDPSALVGAGLALVELGRYEAAIAPLGRAVAEAGGDRAILADAYRGLGVAWRRRGDLDKAIRELRKAVVEDGDDVAARAALGEALIADGGPLDEALRHLERAAGADEPSALALFALGRLALIEDVPAIAGAQLARARTALGSTPTPLTAQLELDILLAQGDAALAEHDAMRAHAFFLEALQRDPKRAEIHARIAAAHRSIGNLDAALASYDRVLGNDPKLEVLRAAVDTAIAAGDLARGAVWSSDLLAKDPTDVRAITARGLALVRDQPEAARALLELAAARDDVDAHVALARLAIANDPTRAAGSARAALRVAPRNAAARAMLVEARAAELGMDRVQAPDKDIAELAAFLERAVATRRDLGHHVGELARAAASLDTPLLVTVMGEFSSGKSSFVNAFIGAEVAPTGITPTTATINVVRYGRERGGRILAHDGTALELGWDALMTHLRALTPEGARAIDRVEILVPLPQLEKIHIVDTPGLNSIQPEHEATARAFIARADAIVWVFTAGQGGKASERAALQSIKDEGKRVLGVLNKADQLSADERREVVEFIGGSLGELVEVVIPVSAREALDWKRDESKPDGNWPVLVGALEERFFRQARALKRDACARVLSAVVRDAQATLEAVGARAGNAAAAARTSRDQLLASAQQYVDEAVTAERKQLSDEATGLYRRAAREVLDLVRPRRLPFSSHTATAADRDYLLALLASGFETAIEGGRRRVAADLATRSRGTEPAARALAAATGEDVAGDLERVAADRIGLAMSRVFDRARAYLRGYLEGGYVEGFFRNDVPRLELAEDAIYHALYRTAPDLDHELGEPLGRAAHDALAAIAQRLDHWSEVVDVQAFDLEVGIGRALELAATRLRG